MTQRSLNRYKLGIWATTAKMQETKTQTKAHTHNRNRHEPTTVNLKILEKIHTGMSQRKHNLFRICGQHIQGKKPL